MKGPEFLKKRYNLQGTEEVKKAVQRKEKRTGEKVGQRPEERIQAYLDRFAEITEREYETEKDEKIRNRGIEALRRVLLKKYVMTEETVPESFFKRQAQQQRELGFGDVDLDETMRSELTENLIQEQRQSLEGWIEYLTSPDAHYPDWFAYFAFRSILSLGAYDKEKKTFSKRTKDTTAPYPTLNQQALASVLDWVTEEKTGTDDEYLQTLLKQQNFGKLYAHALESIPESDYDPEVITGEWIEYPQGSDATLLSQSLQNHNTGWCIAGEQTAASYLSRGSVRVYYSNSPTGTPSIPRLAVVEQDEQITEVRGIYPQQHTDPFIQPILDEELERLGPKGEHYLRASTDMKHLTTIERKHRKEELLTPEDLRFLYEIDDSIQGFGYQEDPRTQEIRQDRDKRKDLTSIFNCKEEQISLTKDEALQGDIIYHYGDLDLNDLTSAEGLQLPETVGGDLDLHDLTSAEGLQLPETVEGSLNFGALTSAEGLQLPKTVGGSLSFDALTSAEGLQLPETVRGYIGLSSLTSAEGLQLPETVGGALYLHSLTAAEELQLPKTVGGDLNLEALPSAEGLQMPETVGGGLSLDALISAEGLQLPKTVGGDLYLYSLTSAEGLQLPETVRGNLNLESLTSAEGLQLPKTMEGSLDLRNLTSAEGLQLPETMEGTLSLNSLTSAEGLQLPKVVEGSLFLSNLTSAEGLQLPEIVRGYLGLSSLTSAEGLRLPETVGRLNLRGRKTAEDRRSNFRRRTTIAEGRERRSEPRRRRRPHSRRRDTPTRPTRDHRRPEAQ